VISIWLFIEKGEREREREREREGEREVWRERERETEPLPHMPNHKVKMGYWNAVALS
jgi:hypothetical protein